MSYNTTAYVFWGFPLDRKVTCADDLPRSKKISTGSFGDDECSGNYICVTESELEIPIGGIKRLNVTLEPLWAPWLRTYCTDNNVPWPSDGPDWYAAPSRF